MYIPLGVIAKPHFISVPLLTHRHVRVGGDLFLRCVGRSMIGVAVFDAIDKAAHRHRVVAHPFASTAIGEAIIMASGRCPPVDHAQHTHTGDGDEKDLLAHGYLR
jgi:hypothetical protein